MYEGKYFPFAVIIFLRRQRHFKEQIAKLFERLEQGCPILISTVYYVVVVSIVKVTEELVVERCNECVKWTKQKGDEKGHASF